MDRVSQERVQGDPRGPGGPPHKTWKTCTNGAIEGVLAVLQPYLA
jgi:hypothetical protein